MEQTIIAITTVINGRLQFIKHTATRTWDNGFVPIYTTDPKEAKDYLFEDYARDTIRRLVPKGLRQFTMEVIDITASGWDHTEIFVAHPSGGQVQHFEP